MLDPSTRGGCSNLGFTFFFFPCSNPAGLRCFCVRFERFLLSYIIHNQSEATVNLMVDLFQVYNISQNIQEDDLQHLQVRQSPLTLVRRIKVTGFSADVYIW